VGLRQHVKPWPTAVRPGVLGWRWEEPEALRLGRWQQLLVDALAEQETVAVQAVVENHLGRRPSGSELHAAQRLAHLLAQRGGGTISHVATGPACTRNGWRSGNRDSGQMAGWTKAMMRIDQRWCTGLSRGQMPGRRQRGSAGGRKS
jgi:hypothetical protein